MRRQVRTLRLRATERAVVPHYGLNAEYLQRRLLHAESVSEILRHAAQHVLRCARLRGHGSATIALGNALRAQGKDDEAIAVYREALRIKPSEVAAHYLLAAALRDQGKDDEADDAYREASRHTPDDLGLPFARWSRAAVRELIEPHCGVRLAVQAGILVVCSAGNRGKDLNGVQRYGGITCPGNEPTVLTVGALNTFATPTRADDGVTSTPGTSRVNQTRFADRKTR